MNGLLDGIVVLDLCRVLAGPYAAMIMADMGATVIKIENPNGGDDTRKMGPFFDKERTKSAYYVNFNRSKLGVTLNLKAPEGKEMFLEMVKKADVVLENYRPGTMEKLGLGYDVLKEVNPSIIYGAVSNAVSVGGVMKMDPSLVDLSDGKFEILLVHEPNGAADINSIVTGILARDYSSSPCLTVLQSKKVCFTFESPVPWTRDGEDGGSHLTLDLRCHQHGVRIYC